MKNIKVEFADGTTRYFQGEGYEHDLSHRMFFVNTEKNRIMIPDNHVKIIGFVHRETSTKDGFVYE